MIEFDIVYWQLTWGCFFKAPLAIGMFQSYQAPQEEQGAPAHPPHFPPGPHLGLSSINQPPGITLNVILSCN